MKQKRSYMIIAIVLTIMLGIIGVYAGTTLSNNPNGYLVADNLTINNSGAYLYDGQSQRSVSSGNADVVICKGTNVFDDAYKSVKWISGCDVVCKSTDNDVTCSNKINNSCQGLHCFIKSGKYNATTIDIINNTFIEGENKFTTILHLFINITGTVNNVKITNLQLDGENQNTHGIRDLNPISNIEIDNLIIKNIVTEGIGFEGLGHAPYLYSNNIKIHDIDLFNVGTGIQTYANGWGYSNVQIYNINIFNDTVDDCIAIVGTNSSIYSNAVLSNIVVDNIYCNQQSTSIGSVIKLDQNTAGSTVYKNIVISNIIGENVKDGITFYHGINAQIYFHDITFRNVNTSGIRLQDYDSTSNILFDRVFIYNATRGIIIQSTNTPASIRNGDGNHIGGYISFKNTFLSGTNQNNMTGIVHTAGSTAQGLYGINYDGVSIENFKYFIYEGSNSSILPYAGFGNYTGNNYHLRIPYGSNRANVVINATYSTIDIQYGDLPMTLITGLTAIDPIAYLNYIPGYKYATIPTCDYNMIFSGKTILYSNGTGKYRLSCIDQTWYGQGTTI